MAQNLNSARPPAIPDYFASSSVGKFSAQDQSEEHDYAPFINYDEEAMVQHEYMQKSNSFAQKGNSNRNLNASHEFNFPLQMQANSFTHNPEFESVQNSQVHNTTPHYGIVDPPSFQNTMSGSGNFAMSGNVNLKESVNQKDAQIDDHWQNIIDWVNSFDDPYCLLVSSLDDFNDGIALCHLVAQVVCNEMDQLQMKQLIHYESNGMGIDQNRRIQNIELALNVLRASTAALPDSVQNDMTADELQSNQLKCYLFIETLRQAQKLGIMASKQPQTQADPPSGVKQEMLESGLVSSPQELPSASPAQHRTEQNMVGVQKFEETAGDKNFPVNFDLNQKPIQEINTSKKDEQKPGSMSPTFKPEKLEYMRDLPLQMPDEIKKKLAAKQQAQAATPKREKQEKSENSNTRSDPSIIKSQGRKKTDCQQDSSYKPLFTEQLSQKKQLAKMKFNSQNYDRVIKNSYERVAASTQRPSKVGSMDLRDPTSMNVDLDLVKDELGRLDREIAEFSNNASGKPSMGTLDITDRTSLAPSISQGPRSPFLSTTNRGVRKDSKPIFEQDEQIEVQEHEVEDVMEQMQKLQIEKKEVEIHPVDERTKLRVIAWLQEEVKLIGTQISVQKLLTDLPRFCRNGVLFGDLINHLSGKQQVIKGLNRAPKNLTSINANFDKVLSHLKEFPRFSSRYLWAQHKAIEGSADVIWGLLDDIWHWHNNKISGHDPVKLNKTNSMKQVTRMISQSKSAQNMSKIPPRPASQFSNSQSKMREYLAIGAKSQKQMSEQAKVKQQSENQHRRRQSSEQKSCQDLKNSRYSKGPEAMVSRLSSLSSQRKSEPYLQDQWQKRETTEIITNTQQSQRKSNENQHPNTLHHQFMNDVEDMSPFMERSGQQYTQKQQPAHENYQSFGASESYHQSTLNQYAPRSPSPNEQRPMQSRVPKATNKPLRPPKHPSGSTLSSVRQNLAQQQMQEQFENVPLIPQRQISQSKSKQSYSNIEMLRSSAKKRYESPRGNKSTGGLAQSHQQNISFGSKPSKSHRQVLQSIPLSTRNATSFGKLVHMKPTQDYENMSNNPHHLSMGPQSLLDGGQQFKSIDSAYSHNNQEASQIFRLTSDNKIVIVDQWLVHLKFHPFMSSEFDYVGLTQDPKRNGIFLAELVAYLNPANPLAKLLSQGSYICQKPNSVQDCYGNFEKVFRCLSNLLKQNGQTNAFQMRMLSRQTIQAMMQGEKAIMYAFLFNLYQAFYCDITDKQSDKVVTNNPTANSVNSSHRTSFAPPLEAPVEIISRSMNKSNSSNNLGSNVVPTIPYLPEEITQLDQSIVQWLKDIRILQSLDINHNQVESLLDLQTSLRNGVLLCTLVSKVFRTKITGIFKDPKTESTCLQNIRKALKVLQMNRKMSQKFTWTEKQICEGQRSILLGLLEDIHRLYDGKPARKRGQNYFDDGPYLGNRYRTEMQEAQQNEQTFIENDTNNPYQLLSRVNDFSLT